MKLRVERRFEWVECQPNDTDFIYDAPDELWKRYQDALDELDNGFQEYKRKVKEG